MIKIKINKQTRMISLTKSILGNDNENLQEQLEFSFEDEFVEGQARLEYITKDGTKNWIQMQRINETYQIPVKSVLAKEGKIDMQIVITEGISEEETPIFKSNVFYMVCGKSINAEIEAPQGYDTWIEIANKKLNEIDNLDIDGTQETDGATIVITRKDKSKKELSIKGQKGDKGDKGDQGIQGKQGEKGIQGEKGLQGERGLKGDKGDSYILTEQDKTEIAVKTTPVVEAKIQPKLDDLQGQITTNNDELNQVVGEVSDVKEQQGLFKQEQTLQNKAIQKNVDDIISVDNKRKINTARIQNVENTLYENGEAQGEFINIQDSALAEMQSVEMSINKAQETTEGINYFDISKVKNFDDVISGTIINNGDSLTITRKSGGGVGSQKLIDCFPNMKIGKQYYLKANTTNNKYNYIYMSGDKNIWKFGDLKTITQNIYDSRIAWYGGTNEPTTISEIMIVEEKDKSKLYEPYTGGIPAPNKDYPQEIDKKNGVIKFTSTGKNLIDINNAKFNKCTLLPNGTVQSNVLNHYYCEMIFNNNIEFLKPNIDLTFSMKEAVTGKALSIIINGEFSDGKTSYEVNSFTVTTNKIVTKVPDTLIKANELVLRWNREGIRFTDTTSIYSDFMLSVGTERGDYEPYQGITNNIDLKENALLPFDKTGIAFREDLGEYWSYIDKNSYIKTYTGDENWIATGTGINTFMYLAPITPKSSKDSTKIYCNYLSYEQVGGSNTDEGLFIANQNILRIRIKGITTIEQFKAKLREWNTAGKPMQICYLIDEPLRERIWLDKIDIMNMTYNPITNAFTDKTNVLQRIKYYRDFVYTIKKLQVDKDKLEKQQQDIEKRVLALENKPVQESEVNNDLQVK